MDIDYSAVWGCKFASVSVKGVGIAPCQALTVTCIDFERQEKPSCQISSGTHWFDVFSHDEKWFCSVSVLINTMLGITSIIISKCFQGSNYITASCLNNLAMKPCTFPHFQ